MALKYNCTHVHLHVTNMCEKGTFFHRKALNVHDALRMSKTVFLQENGILKFVFHTKRVPFSLNLFFLIYVSAREAKVYYDFQNTT